MNEKPPPGTVLNSNGSVAARSEDSLENLNLPPGVQALVETRINAAIDKLHEQNRDNLERLAEDKSKNWKKLTGVLAAIALISFCFNIFAVFGAKEKIQTWMVEYFQKEIVKPEFNKTLKTEIQAEAASYANAKLVPLENRARILELQITDFQKNVELKQNKLSTDQIELRQLLRLPQWATSAKAGDNIALKELTAVATGSDSNAVLARIFLSDVNQHYESDRHQLTEVISMDSVSRNPIQHTLEEALAALKNPDPKNRESAANRLYSLHLKSAVSGLAEQLERESNLRVIARITRALQELTKQQFEPLEKNKAIAWWDENKSRHEYIFPEQKANAATRIFSPNTSEFSHSVLRNAAEKQLSTYKDILEIEPKADLTRFHYIISLAALGKMNEAQTQLAMMADASSRWAKIAKAWLAMLRIHEDEAVIELNELLDKFPNHAALIRQWSVFLPLATNSNMKWPPKPELK